MNHFLDLPPLNNSYFSEEIKYELHHDLIFVFGSNLAGRHGAGAAKQALLEFRAIYGRGVGLQGSGYAIPTKDQHLKVLALKQIQKHVNTFLQFHKDNPDLYFFLTAIGTGYAGYKHSQIAPMFKGVQNSWISQHWKPYLK